MMERYHGCGVREGRATSLRAMHAPSSPGLPRALLLDLDGTLVDSEAVHTESIQRALSASGIVLDEAERRFVIGHAWQEIYATLRVAERTGMGLSELQRAAVQAKDAMFEEGIGFSVVAGARELVALGAELAIPMAIVSGSCRAEIAQALELLGIGDYLEFYLGAEDYSRGKPAPDGYLAAATQLRVDPDGCLVFEDSEAGIASARAAGMRVVATRAANAPPGSPDHQDQSAAIEILDDLTPVSADLLRRWMGA